ncbi:MAG TPA: hydantoinase/oxoprolinase family protein [Spirochaetota bacterium]|nr:hydantoinase/oxoprolinase family protein [Spirochaetota bacterium]HRZ28130.1 hydantoinase/oxoprolinase family protein [Spirochaetota bacterium]HSA13680.1 hydantoinase/oxoprolinase family protein [Spirochaetota bacterium]
MYLGLDVGGTHTDAVLIDNNKIVASFKAPTDHKNLLTSINRALAEVTKSVDRSAIKRINLSTTLSTNAIVENKTEKVGVIISGGPGIDPESFRLGDFFYVIPGSIDHRGTLIKDLESAGVKAALEECAGKNVRVYSLVTKFSTRNPGEEEYLAEKVGDQADFVSLGHRLSGQLNFPRRVGTAYFNSAVWRLYNQFCDAINESLKELGIDTQVNVLKADGGTMPLSLSRELPVETILSGPAASIMGIISLCDITDDSIILDIGGTTTDIAIFASGAPLVERQGISFASVPTLVRSLLARSIGIGGDSRISVQSGKVTVGPMREGPSMAEGGPVITLVDALNYNGTISYGNTAASKKGVDEAAKKAGMKADVLVKASIEFAVGFITDQVNAMLAEINDKPVYTIHEMLENRAIVPEKVYLMGGPAQGFARYLHASFNKEVIIPREYAVANAIGAALAKPTFQVELFADTSKGQLIIPNLNIREKVAGDYTVEQAEDEARSYLVDYCKRMGIQSSVKDIEIIESSSFKMVQGYFSTGRDIRVKCQIKPGVEGGIA